MTAATTPSRPEAHIEHGERQFTIYHDNAKDHIFSIIRTARRFYEREFLEALAVYIKPGELVLDVGANIGNHTLFFAGVCGARVIAFEPNPRSADLLRANIAANGLDDMARVEEIALGASEGAGEMENTGGENNLGAASVKIDGEGAIVIRRLDSIELAERPVLIKVDVEGMDLDVLKGAEQTLRTHTPIVAVEAADRATFLAIASFLEGLGYAHLETHNYTPTHVFEPVGGTVRKTLLTRLSREMGLNAIDLAAVRSKSDQQLNRLFTKVAALEKTNSALVADLARVEGQSAEANALKEMAAGVAEALRALSSDVGELRRSLMEFWSDADSKQAQRVTQPLLRAELADLLSQLQMQDSTRAEQTRARLEEIAQTLTAQFQNEAAAKRAYIEALSETQSEQLQAEAAKIRVRLDAVAEQARERAREQDRLQSAAAAQLDVLASKAVELQAALERALSQIQTEEAGLRSEAKALAAAQEDMRAMVRRAERNAAAAVDASLALGAWLQPELETLRREIVRDLRESIAAGVKDALLDAVRQQSTAFAQVLGAHGAELVLQLARRNDAPDTTRPRRAFFDAGEPHTLDYAPRREVDPDPQRRHKPGMPPVSRTQAENVVPLKAVGIAAQPAPKPAPAIWHDELLGAEDMTLGWEGRGWSQGGARLASSGTVETDTTAPFSGFVTRQFACAGGGLLGVAIDVADAGEAELIVRLRSEADEPLGPDVPLVRGANVVRFFAQERVERVKIYVLARQAQAPAKFSIGKVSLYRLDADAHQRAVRAKIGQPVIASMATIPSRRTMLKDCVTSLLAQCDYVRVFLNNYPDVPDFLSHPRIEVRRSQDWDDRGDAGKMFWLDKDESEGYRLITDDDLLFPPDFAETMCAKAASHDNRAVYATHGVLLRQPIAQYYDDQCRAATFHFARRLDEDRAVHIAATNALCMHSSAVKMRWPDFMYCNSADIWLALYAQREGLPLFTPARPQGWVRENRHAAPGETIYDHSRKRSRSRMDSSLVQDAVLRFAWPVTLQPSERPKLGVCLFATSPENLQAAIASWTASRTLGADWVVVLGFAEDPAMQAAIDALKIEHETHLVIAPTAAEQTTEAAALLERLKLDGALFGFDDLRFEGSGWESGLLMNAAEHARTPQVEALVPTHDGRLSARSGAAHCVIWRWSDGRPTPASWASQANWSSHLRVEATPGADIGALQSLTQRPPTRRPTARAPKRAAIAPGRRLNDVFERVLVLNLDRRPDRWAQAEEQLSRFGIKAQRFSAIDGTDPAVAAEYKAYAKATLAQVSSELPPISYSEDFYLRAASEAARLAHLEQRSGKKAIASRGAWAYLRSYEAMLEQALADQVESLLVLDDDFVLHRQTPELFAQAYSELPDDWLILKLGTLQYNWNVPWATWRSEHLYRTNGSAIGSHAVGMKFEILPYLLDHVRRMDMPYDVGALSAATRAFAERSFVIFPNVAIQRLQDTDIGTSEFQNSRGIEEIAATYRWTLSDYLL